MSPLCSSSVTDLYSEHYGLSSLLMLRSHLVHVEQNNNSSCWRWLRKSAEARKRQLMKLDNIIHVKLRRRPLFWFGTWGAQNTQASKQAIGAFAERPSVRGWDVGFEVGWAPVDETDGGDWGAALRWFIFHFIVPFTGSALSSKMKESFRASTQSPVTT